MTGCLIAVCAYTLERWPQLEAAVRQAAAQCGPRDRVVVVVDHNPDLLQRARLDLAGERVAVVANEHRRGLSGGRNTAMEQPGEHEIVVYLDDDAVPEPGWLEALRGHYADPAVIAVGGVAWPVWPPGRERPVTLPAAGPRRGEYDWVVGCTYAGQPTTAAGVRNLMGCNMSFRRDRLLALGGFDEEMGRVGTTPLGCEETELCIRATRREPGARIVFEPRAAVRHHVTAARMTWHYLWSRCRAEGISKAYVGSRVTHRAGLATELAHTRTTLPRGFAREVGRRNPRGAFAIASGLVVAGYGYAVGRVALARSGRGGTR